MLADILVYTVDRSPRLRKLLFRNLFEFLARRYRHLTHWTQMNYGYAEGPGRGHTIALEPGEEVERYCHQLYFRTVDGIDLIDRDVVEVSCGRGGGAAFIHRCFRPRTLTGIDIANEAIEFCRRVHRAPGLHFLQGDAEELPLPDASADAVINVEASLCYPDRDRFFSEVYRVLRTGGHFLYADLHRPAEIESLKQDLQHIGFELVQSGDISNNVAFALQLDSERRIEYVRANTPRFLRKLLQAFAGAPGTRVPNVLKNGTMGYYCLTLRKPSSEHLAIARAA